MAKLIHTTTAPKRFADRFDIDMRLVDEKPDDVLVWIKDTLTGIVHWRSTQYRDPKTKTWVSSSRQRNFSDGYFIYTFWLSNRNDTLIFKLRWGQIV